MTAAARPEPTVDVLPAAGAATGRQEWWADVQTGFSALLTASAHATVETRRAG